MPKIDLHTHILTEPNLHERYGYEGFVPLEHIAPCRGTLHVEGRPFREIDDCCWDPARCLQPNVMRMSPVPLYSSFHDVWRAAAALAEALDA